MTGTTNTPPWWVVLYFISNNPFFRFINILKKQEKIHVSDSYWQS